MGDQTQQGIEPLAPEWDSRTIFLLVFITFIIQLLYNNLKTEIKNSLFDVRTNQ
jgi:hypothetical protein